MEKIVQIFRSRLNNTTTTFKRYLWNEINWSNRLIAITGARGVGKTTFLLQYIKETYKDSLEDVLYASLDNLYFTKTTLTELTDNFVKHGGKYLFLDEVHKYPDWSIEIKNIYDNYPQLKIVITGSSAINILQGRSDLSRRMIIYKMNGLSFREFLEFKYGIIKPVLQLTDLLNNANEICNTINSEMKPHKYFEEYLQTGYYPYFKEDEQNYFQRIEQTVNEIIETDLPKIEHINYSTIYNIRRLMAIIAQIVPFKPNILKISQQIGISRESFLKYIHWLAKAELLMILDSDTYGISKMNKPDKIYLNNTNLMYSLSETSVNAGTIRETFFFNQLKVYYKVSYTEIGDFLIDNKYLFEIGGKNKTNKQIAGVENAYIAAQNIEYPYRNTIPVWLFGFVY